MKRLALITLSALCANLLLPQPASAMSGTSQVAWPGKPVMTVSNWPEGTMMLVNDPLRLSGWNPWFS